MSYSTKLFCFDIASYLPEGGATMISIAETRSLIGEEAEGKTDEQIARTRSICYSLAKLIVEKTKQQVLTERAEKEAQDAPITAKE